MSSKKILAASMAAVLATGSIAAVATADAPAASDDTVVISGLGMGAKKTTSATISLNSTTASMSTALAVDSATDQTKNAYSKMRVGLWEAFEDFNITAMSNANITFNITGEVNYQVAPFIDDGGIAGAAQNDKYGKVMAVKDATGKDIFPLIKVSKETGAGDDAKIELSWVDADGEPATALTHAKYTKVTDVTGKTDADLTEDALKDFVKKVNDSLKVVGSCTASAAGLATKDITASSSVALTGTWRKAITNPGGTPTGGTTPTWADGTGDGATKGSTYGPVEVETKFTLADGEQLANDADGTGFKALKSAKWTLTGDFTVDGNTYDKYIDKKYGVGGTYDWNNGWTDQGTDFIYDTTTGTKYGFAVVAQSAVDGKDAVKNGLQLPDNLTKEPDVQSQKGDLKIKGDGSINLFYGGVVNPEVLQKLNAGGTVTFELKDEVPADQYILGNLQFLGGNGNFFIDVAHNYTLSGNKVTFEFPAGLTRHDGDKDPWGDFLMTWDIRVRGVGSGMGNVFEGEQPSPTEWDSSIVSITFKANGGASVDGDNSGSQGGNTSNPGSTSGNPNTGIALAVAPIVLAAGAVVTIASKKRK